LGGKQKEEKTQFRAHMGGKELYFLSPHAQSRIEKNVSYEGLFFYCS
jgi:YHS domain-containing protein